MGEERRRKLARDASPEENAIPGSHGPAQDEAQRLMCALLDAFQESLPGWNFALFMIEPEERARAEGRLPRFNYGSTVARPDMIAILNAWLARQTEMEAIDKAMSGEAEGRA